MFNQLTPSDLVSAIGVTVRDAARSDDPAGDFQRDQLMSAYSATRHLAVELSSFGPELERFRQAVLARVRSTAADATTADLGTIAARLEDDPTAGGIGGAVADLLAALRDDDGEAAAGLRADVHVLLRELADREVDLLADALG
jgi:hypothetical protein